MISDHRCFFCFTRAFEKLLEKETISNEAKNDFTRGMVKCNVIGEFLKVKKGSLVVFNP